jgi:hypothetical protein
MTLTVESPDYVLRRAKGAAAEWWAVLAARSPFAVDEVDAKGLILAALSRPYIEMVAADWAAWPADRLHRLRIFSKDVTGLPAALSAQWMRYDDRLDQIDGLAGTQGDFAQRALHHFAKSIAGASRSAADDATLVASALAPYTVNPKPDRARISDDEAVALILRDWDVVQGRSGAMLSHLRRTVGVACEQGRFKLLFKQAASQRSGALL